MDWSAVVSDIWPLALIIGVPLIASAVVIIIVCCYCKKKRERDEGIELEGQRPAEQPTAPPIRVPSPRSNEPPPASLHLESDIPVKPKSPHPYQFKNVVAPTPHVSLHTREFRRRDLPWDSPTTPLESSRSASRGSIDSQGTTSDQPWGIPTSPSESFRSASRSSLDSRRTTSLVDLRYHSEARAISKVKEKLKELKYPVFITGWGRHSKGEPVLKPAVELHLSTRGIPFDHPNKGRVAVIKRPY